jgi:argininosuccinate lyase
MLLLGRPYRGYRGAGIRLEEPLDPDLAARLSKFERVGRLGEGIHAYDLAQVVVLFKAGLVSRQEARRMRDALRRLEPDVAAARDRVGGGVHSGERFLVRRLGLRVGGRLHTGRSSWDVEAVAERIALRGALLEVIEDLLQWRVTLLRMAGSHVHTVMPLATHGQVAGPTTFGHVLHAQAVAAARHTERLFDAYRRLNVSPAGAAAGTGSPFGLSQRTLASLLGFDRVQANTLDAVRGEDVLTEVLAALAAVAQSLASFGADLVLWSGEHFQYVRLADRHCHTSSMMPQKRNPEGAMQLQALGRLTISWLAGSSTAEVWQAMDHVKAGLRLAARVLEGLWVDRRRMRDATIHSWASATMLAALLVQRHGLSWREAHQVVGRAVRAAEARGEMEPTARTPLDLRQAARATLHFNLAISEEAVTAALDPDRAVEAHDSAGGPAPRQMRLAIAAGRALIRRDRSIVNRLRRRTARAAARLERELNAL